MNRLAIEACGVAAVIVLLATVMLPRLPSSQRVNSINTPEHFPDPAFRQIVETFVGVEPGAYFTAKQAAGKTETFLCNDKTIRYVTGLEHLSGITELDLQASSLEAVDLSGNPRLKWLHLSSDRLRSLDVSENPELEQIHLSGGVLERLDVSQCVALSTLYCRRQRLTELDVGSNTALRDMGCSGNALTTLDLRNNKQLQTLDCSNNRLSDLDLSRNTRLWAIHCAGNHLTQVPRLPDKFVTLTALRVFDIRRNDLDCDDWSDIQMYRQRFGEPLEGERGGLTRGLGFSPQNGLDPFDCSE